MLLPDLLPSNGAGLRVQSVGKPRRQGVQVPDCCRQLFCLFRLEQVLNQMDST